jgi:uncharacterized damage-inducible protein DinB
MSYSLIKHLNYSVWATAKLSQILENVDDSLLKKETPSSFPTIEKTILHICDADLIWLRRLQGQSLTGWPSKDFNGDREQLIEGWAENTVALRNYVESRGDDFLSATIDYSNTAGHPFGNTVDEIIHHVVNHGTFHRGQIITMLRANGVNDLQSTDLITYLRAVTT